MYWPKAAIAGAVNEPGAWLLNTRVPINRRLPLMQREWLGYSLASRQIKESAPKLASFVERICEKRRELPAHDVVFHVGATWNSKKWPLMNCIDLVKRLSVDLSVVLLGLAEEIEPLRGPISDCPNVSFAVGSIEAALIVIAQSRVAVTMDSGAMHFAAALDIPTLSLFGPTNPSEIVPLGKISWMYDEKLSCQPCWSSRCSQRAVYCMELLDVTFVERKVRALLEKQASIN
jgi:ADP-heptose:LPS heptosyltransferase